MIDKKTILRILMSLPVLMHWARTRRTHTPIKLKYILWQKILRISGKVPWQVHWTSKVDGVKDISVGVEVSPGYSPGCYIHGSGGITIGDYTQIAPNVGIISSNHDPLDGRKKIDGSVHIGSYSWIGMNAVVLPGVTVGDFTVIGAGAVVTKSFPHGYQVLAGNPAKAVKTLDSSMCIRYRSEYEYVGYHPK